MIKKGNNTQFFTLIILFVAVLTLSSCNANRGYGCPHELEIALDLLSFLK